MSILCSPAWVERNRYSLNFKTIDDIPEPEFALLNNRLRRLQKPDPIVSIVIPAWNEEMNIVNCISSLSYIETEIPFEIIVVNNNSTDNTQRSLNKLHVRSCFQVKQGCGPARQMGQEMAKGKYILLADADCIYPKGWIDLMLESLQKPGVVCVYGRYSFIEDKGFPRWKLFLYEKLKDMIARVRHIKRPYLNSLGLNMGYIKEYGLRVGYVDYKIRGEDGRLCFDLMQFGKVLQVKSGKARAWTEPRTLQIDGTFYKALYVRLKKERRHFFSHFTLHPPHDTKISKN